MEEEMIYIPHPTMEMVPSHFIVPNTLEKIHFWFCNSAEIRWAYRKLNAGGTIAETEGMLLRSGKFKNPNEPFVTGGGCNGSVYPHHYIKDAAGTLTKAGKMRKKERRGMGKCKVGFVLDAKDKVVMSDKCDCCK